MTTDGQDLAVDLLSVAEKDFLSVWRNREILNQTNFNVLRKQKYWIVMNNDDTKQDLWEICGDDGELTLVAGSETKYLVFRDFKVKLRPGQVVHIKKPKENTDVN